MTPRVFGVVGSPGSGKDFLIRAVKDLGSRRAEVVPKHTDRKHRRDEGMEMLFPGDDGYNLSACDIVYENFGNRYGIESARIWEGLGRGTFQVVVVSNYEAINNLRGAFGRLLVLIYVHSAVSAEQFREQEGQGFAGERSLEADAYVERRANENAY